MCEGSSGVGRCAGCGQSPQSFRVVHVTDDTITGFWRQKDGAAGDVIVGNRVGSRGGQLPPTCAHRRLKNVDIIIGIGCR